MGELIKKILKTTVKLCKRKLQEKDQNIVRGSGGTGKFVSALFLQSRFRVCPLML